MAKYGTLPKVAKPGQKWSDMINLTFVTILGKFWSLWTISGKTCFFAPKHLGQESNWVFQAKIWFLSKMIHRVKMIRNKLNWLFTLLNLFGTLAGKVWKQFGQSLISLSLIFHFQHSFINSLTTRGSVAIENRGLH